MSNIDINKYRNIVLQTIKTVGFIWDSSTDCDLTKAINQLYKEGVIVSAHDLGLDNANTEYCYTLKGNPFKIKTVSDNDDNHCITSSLL